MSPTWVMMGHGDQTEAQLDNTADGRYCRAP
jgi:hypothetical protein